MIAPKQTAAADAGPLPEGWLLEPTEQLRVSNDFTLLLGGTPATLVRVSPGGAAVLKRLFAGGAIGSSRSERSLARRLELNGMALASPPSPSDSAATVPRGLLAQLTVVIPYYNDRDGLDRTLAALGPGLANHKLDVVVVDDASATELRLQDQRVRVIRHDQNRGPAAARNTGSRAASTDVLLFIDSGAELGVDTLTRLVSYLDDPHTSAVAPRIIAAAGASPLISTYERSQSPLDLGSTSALVRPLSAVPYVPSTCLAVRAQSFRQASGFTEELRYGEDVDLVWRLSATGAVRFIAHLQATHPARDSLAEFARQRFRYGGSAAQLAGRHHGATTPLILERWTAAAAALTAVGVPFAIPAVTAHRSRQLASSLPQDLPGRSMTAITTVIKGQLAMAAGFAKSLSRPYGPLVAVGLAATSTSPVAPAAVLVATRLISLRRPAHVALSLVDDAAYSAGVWEGTLRQRSWRCLIPRFV